MPPPDLKVVGVMRGGDFHHAGAEIGFHIIVCHNGNFAPHQRQNQRFAHDIPIALIIRVYRHGGIAQQRLRAGGGKFQIPAPVLERVAQMPEVPRFFLIFHLRVGDGGQAFRAPVDDALSAVDQPLVIQAHKHFFHRGGASVVQREALSCPVAGGAKAFELLHNAPAVLLFPCPCAREEPVTPKVVFGHAFFAHGLHDLGFGRNRRVIGTGEPERDIAAHPLVADENVLQRLVQRVPHVKLPRNVRGRDYDGVGGFGFIDFRCEVTFFTPVFINAFLKLTRGVGFRQVMLLGHV